MFYFRLFFVDSHILNHVNLALIPYIFPLKDYTYSWNFYRKSPLLCFFFFFITAIYWPNLLYLQHLWYKLTHACIRTASVNKAGQFKKCVCSTGRSMVSRHLHEYCFSNEENPQNQAIHKKLSEGNSFLSYYASATSLTSL